MKGFDIVGIGCATVDDYIYVDRYPRADSKVQIRNSDRQCGGLTGTALVAAAKLGGSCAYAGVLGDEDFSEAIESNFRFYGVDVSGVQRVHGARPIHSTIVVSESDGGRTIFFEAGPTIYKAQLGDLDHLIRTAKVLFVDHVGVDRSIEAAKIAKAAGIPVVADLEDVSDKNFDRLLYYIDHLVLSEKDALALTGDTFAGAAASALKGRNRSVVVTCGVGGCWFLNEDWELKHHPSLQVEAVDTTGCGDVFHGAYALSLARGVGMEARVRYATIAAGLKATRRGGQSGAPSAAELSKHLEESAFRSEETL